MIKRSIKKASIWVVTPSKINIIGNGWWGQIIWNFNSGQITIIPKPELRGFWGDSLTKPPFKVTSAEVVTICPVNL